MTVTQSVPMASSDPDPEAMTRQPTRRTFLRVATVAGAGLCLPSLLTSCRESAMYDPSRRVNFSLSGAGPLNLVYAHALLMWDFYARLQTLVYLGRTIEEQVWQEVVMRFRQDQTSALKSLIPRQRIQDTLYFDFSFVRFASRESVLEFLVKFENLGVEMCNGLVPYLRDPLDLQLTGQYASICARIAVLPRDWQSLYVNHGVRTRMLNSEVIASNGRVPSIEPAQALAIMQPYFLTELSVG